MVTFPSNGKKSIWNKNSNETNTECMSLHVAGSINLTDNHFRGLSGWGMHSDSLSLSGVQKAIGTIIIIVQMNREYYKPEGATLL